MDTWWKSIWNTIETFLYHILEPPFWDVGWIMMSRISRYHVDWVGEYVSLICGCDQYKYLIGRVSFGRQRFHMVVADLRDVSAVVTVGYTYVGDTAYYHSLDIIHAWFIILLMFADEYAMPICSKHNWNTSAIIYWWAGAKFCKYTTASVLVKLRAFIIPKIHCLVIWKYPTIFCHHHRHTVAHIRSQTTMSTKF